MRTDRADDAAPAARRAAAPVSLGLVLLCLAGTVMLGAATKLPCASGEWSGDPQYRLLCYSDVVPLLLTEHLQGNRLPYLDACRPAPPEGPNCDEYPVLTMYLMRTAAWMWNRSTFGFLLANEVLLAICAVAIGLCLWLVVGVRALYFVLAPTFVVYAFMNWDLLAVALATGAVVALLRRKDRAAGVLLGLGAAAKLYPALLVIPFVVHRIRQREPDGAIGLFWWSVGAWVAVNAPFAALAPGAWWTFFRFNAARVPDWDSIAYIACRHLPSTCVRTGVVNALSLVAFLGLSAVVWVAKARRDPAFERWTLAFPIVVLFLLTNKVYSPQYGLWLLPLFALALPDLRAFVLFSAADVAVFATRFRFFGSLDGYPWGWPQGWFELAVLARAAVLVACVVWWVRRAPEPLALDASAPPGSDAGATIGPPATPPDGEPPGARDGPQPEATASHAQRSAWTSLFGSWAPGVGLLLVIASFTLSGGYLLKAACLDVPWDGRQWSTDCANDIDFLFFQRGLTTRDAIAPRLEYPAGTVLYVGAVTELTAGARGFFQGNAVGIAAAGLAVTGMLAAIAADRRRVLLFALGPPLFLYAFQNWDLLAVALLVAGLVAIHRGRDGWGGAWLGLGAAVKLFPLLALPAALVAIRRHRAEPRRAALRCIGGFLAAFAIPNAIVAAISPASWSFFWRFQGARFPNPETAWFMIARHLVGMFPSEAWKNGYVHVANVGSLLLLAAFAVAAIAYVARRPERSWVALAFVLLVAAIATSKILSPQYLLWLLPFFALLPFPWYAFVAFVVADLAVLLSVNDYFLTISASGDWPHALVVLEVTVWLRYAVLGWLALLALRMRSSEPAPGTPPAPAPVAHGRSLTHGSGRTV